MSQPPRNTDTSVRSVGKDLLLYIPGRAIPAVVQVLTVTTLTWFFQHEVGEIGRYELTFRFILFLSTFTVLWLNMAILRFYPAHAARAALVPFYGALGFLKYVSIGIGLIAGALAWAFGPDWLVGSYRDLIPIGLVVFVTYSLYETGLIILRAQRQPARYSIATSLNAAFRLPLAILLFTAFGFGIDGMLWALAITYGLTHLALVARSVGPPQLPRSAEDREVLAEIFRYGAPVWGIQLLNFLINTSDRYLLNGLRDEASVGYYMVATSLIDQPMWIVFQTFTLAVFPIVAAAWETKGRAEAETLVRDVTRVFLVLCLPLAVLLAALARPIFFTLAQGEAANAWVAAPWIAAAAFAYGLSYFANMGLHLAKRTGILLLMTALALAVNIGANIALIPMFDYLGAGMARVLGNTALVVLVAAAGHRYLHWRFPWLSLVRCGAVGALVGFPLYYAAQQFPPNLLSLALLGSAGGGAMFVLLVVSGELPPRLLREGIATARRKLGR